MKKTLCAVLLILSSFVFKSAYAQTNTEHTLWGAWFHSQKFSDHWGLLFDLQMRSADDVKYLRHPLIRPAVAYYFNKNTLLSAGYLYTGTRRKTDIEDTFRPEHRLFEQFIINYKVLNKRIPIQHRFRLEQRFINSLGAQEAYFAQRFRYFVRGMIPLKADSGFTRGAFLALQNEFFANVQNKNKLNGQVFDQNRAYVALGYRFSKKIDIEAGYLNQYVNATGPVNINNNVIQVALYTRFGN